MRRCIEDKVRRSKTYRTEYFDALKAFYPDAKSLREGTLNDDFNGIDYWLELKSGYLIGIDAKRAEPKSSCDWNPKAAHVWIPRYRENSTKDSWAADYKKRTMYVLFSFTPRDHIYSYLVNHKELCRFMNSQWERLKRQYFILHNRVVNLPVHELMEHCAARREVPLSLQTHTW